MMLVSSLQLHQFSPIHYSLREACVAGLGLDGFDYGSIAHTERLSNSDVKTCRQIVAPVKEVRSQISCR